MTYSNCVVVQFLYDWQTLIGGVLALAAAIGAFIPVYKQLGLMRAQNEAIVRDKIGDMIVNLDSQAVAVTSITSKPLSDIHSALHHFETYGPGYIPAEWANEQLSSLDKVESMLKALFAKSHDVEAIEACKLELLDALSALVSVLWDVFAVENADRFPEEYNWTDEERAAAVARSNEAEGEVQGIASRSSRAVIALSQAFEAQRASLVHRLRVIDDALLASS